MREREHDREERPPARREAYEEPKAPMPERRERPESEIDNLPGRGGSSEKGGT
ncbi:MAG: hypothetical protein HY698_11910 [Deltaproteobacteria bacterium]|nr:hypothetical protein [Deltaproteobacteria bacterium]